MQSIQDGKASKQGRLRMKAAAFFASMALTACGGGNVPSEEGSMQMKLLAASPVIAEDVAVTGMTKLSESRISRTAYEYVFRVTVKNNSTVAQNDVQAMILSVGVGTVVVDGSVVVGSLAVGASASPADTITLRHDRTVPFDPLAVKWQVTATPAGPTTGRLPGRPGDAAIDNVADVSSSEAYPTASYEIDPLSGTTLLRQLIQIAFKPGTTVAQINTLLDELGGKIVRTHEQTALLYVRIPDPGSRSALNDLLARVEGHGFVAFATDTQFPPPEAVPSLPFTSQSSLSSIAHHLSARGHLAWNAAQAVKIVNPMPRPSVLIADNFGSGPPNAGLYSLGFAGAVDVGFVNTLLCSHGYHVAGIIGGTYNDASPVTGMYPGPLTLATEIVDRQGIAGYFNEYKVFSPCQSVGVSRTVEDRIVTAIKAYQRIGRKVVLNTSFGNSISGGLHAPLDDKERKKWLILINGKYGDDPNPVVVDNYFHAASAGNNRDSTARSNMGWTVAAIDGSLNNTAVVENRVSGTAAPFDAGCIYNEGMGASKGGNISAFGTDVTSYKNKSGDKISMTGSSMASPQVAGLAAFLWAINPLLKSSEVLNAIVSNARTSNCPDGGANYIDAYATILAGDDPAALATIGQAKKAPARLAILDLNEDGEFKDDDVLNYIDAFSFYEKDRNAFNVVNRYNNIDPSRYDLNGDGKVGGGTTAPFNLNIDYVAGRKHLYGRVSFEFETGRAVELDENLTTDFQILCYYAYSKIFTGDISAMEAALSSKGLSCRGPLVGMQLKINDTNAGWTGLPANIALQDFYVTTIPEFQFNGNSATCGTGERGGPLFSNVVEPGAVFQGARTVIGMPNTVNGQSTNRRNCSSFVAIKTVTDPKTGKLFGKYWVNATGRAQRFGGPVVLDWEYQIRYYSGDPLNNYSGQFMQVGLVPNSGNFIFNFNATSYSLSYLYASP